TRTTLERRVNALGVNEPVIQTRGNDQIIVELPGVANPEEAVHVLQQTALLEIIDPKGQYLRPGTLVNTSLGPASDALGGTPTAHGEGTPAATPVAAPDAAAAATPLASPEATPVAAAAATDQSNGPTYD